MSQNTRLLLIALVILVVFGLFLQSLVARSLQESFGEQTVKPQIPVNPSTPQPGIEPIPGASTYTPPKPDDKNKKPGEKAGDKKK